MVTHDDLLQIENRLVNMATNETVNSLEKDIAQCAGRNEI